MQVLAEKDPQLIDKFKEAPIIVGENVLRDALNNKSVEGFATKTNQVIHYYHADDRYCRS
jgi:hypothetical protein